MRNPKFLGVYSRKSRRQGAARRLFFVWRDGSGDFIVQELDAALLPKSPARLVEQKAFVEGYRQEPSILAMPVSTPDVRAALPKSSPEANLPADVDMLRLERARRAKQLETDMRGNFRKALSALSRPRDRQGALAALEQLIRVREGIIPPHKHMFRDFGVLLRKKNLLELALLSSNRVLELAPDDDHAHFNIARIYALLGSFAKAQAHVERAISLDGAEPVYPRLLAHIRREAVSAAPKKGRRL